MKMQQRVKRLLVLAPALALVLAVSLPAAAVDGMLLANGVSTEQNAKDYYQMIDPQKQRTTQADWKILNGFGAPENQGQVVVVTGHQNIGDLGFWRRIESLTDQRPATRGNVAMTTYNFVLGPNAPPQSGVSRCCDPANALSIVNMEYSPGPSGDKITKFYAYDSVTGERKTATFFTAAQNNLYLPNACASCHGGGRDFTVRGGSTGGGFVAFDFNTFSYIGSYTNQPNNEGYVKKLNLAVLATNPDIPVKTQIRGLYGGRTLPSPTQVDYMPASWSTEPKLWHAVVRECEGCHTLSAETFLSLNTWKSRAGTIRQEVFNINQMPNSDSGQNYFHNRINLDGTTDAWIVNDALTRFGSLPGTQY